MAGTFILGETKVRPGSYFNIQTKDIRAASFMNGVTAVVFKSDFGPLNSVVELNAEEGYEKIFGTGLTTDALREAFAGGANTIIACRVGSGGSHGTIILKDINDKDALILKGKYPGEKEFTVTIRSKLSDSSLKECIFYDGTAQFEKIEFAAGGDEATALVEAIASSPNFIAETLDDSVESEIVTAANKIIAAIAGTKENLTGCTMSYDQSRRIISIILTGPFSEVKNTGLFDTLSALMADGYTMTVDGVEIAGLSDFKATESYATLAALEPEGSASLTCYISKGNEIIPYVLSVTYPSADAAVTYSKDDSGDKIEESNVRILANVTQSEFMQGENPKVTITDYSNAFAQLEPFEFNTVCVDTEDMEVLLMLQSFLSRIFDAGSLAQAVVAEKHTVDLKTREANAMAFNDEKINYVLNAHIDERGMEIDGYQTAARVAGMISAVSSGSSLTHTVISGFTTILEKLTNSEMITAEKRGCIVFSYNKAKQVWIDNAINTLITPAENQDEGWKKIRRVKTRFELIRRINTVADDLVGKVDNDSNGRNTVISQMQNVGDAMVEEGKLVSCTVTESKTYKADGDSAWFDIDVIDKDSMEHIYLTFYFQFSTNA